jgi:hypothetical protein
MDQNQMLVLTPAKLHARPTRTVHVRSSLQVLRNTGAWTALACNGIIAFVLVAACALLLHLTKFLGCRPEEHSVEHLLLRLPPQVSVQILSLAWTFLSAAQWALIFPSALGMIQGEGYVHHDSVLVAGSAITMLCCVFGARHLLSPWLQARNRIVVLGFIAGHIMVALLSDAAAQPSPWGLSIVLCSLCSSLSKIGLGVCTSFGNVFFMMAMKVTPQESMVHFSLWRVSATCLGASVGALTSSTDVSWIALPWLLLGCITMLVVPNDLDHLYTDVPSSASLRSPDVCDGELHPDECVSSSPQMTLWVVAAALSFARGFLAVSFEATLASIFLADFFFSALDVREAVGSSIACGAFVIPLVILGSLSGALDIARVSAWLASFVALSALLLIRPLLNLVGDETSGFWLAFMANAIATPAIHLMGGLVEGLALRQVTADTLLTKENLITVDSALQDGMARMLALPFIRFLYTFGGRSLCAAALLACACFAIAGTLTARKALATISADNMQSKAWEKILRSPTREAREVCAAEDSAISEGLTR